MKRTLRLLLCVALVIVMIASFTACKTEEKPMETEEMDEMAMHIEIVSKGFQHQFWQAVKAGSDAAAADTGWSINFVGPEGESAVADQVNMLADAINKEPAAIAFAALDTQAALDELNKAMNSGIPMLSFDSGVPDAPEGMILATIATNNYAAGALGAEGLYDGIKADESTGTAQMATKENLEASAADNQFVIGVVVQDQISDSLYSRTQGFVEKMVELVKADGYSVAVVGNGSKEGISPMGDEDTAQVVIVVAVAVDATPVECTAAAETVYQREDLNAVFSPNQGGVDGIIAVAEARPENWMRDTFKVVGFDAGAAQKAQVRSGNFFGAITQDPYTMGYQTVIHCIAAAKGETVEDFPLDGKWYNADNMDDDDIAPLLYD